MNAVDAATSFLDGPAPSAHRTQERSGRIRWVYAWITILLLVAGAVVTGLRYRATHRGPDIRYETAALDAWLAGKRRRSTSDQGGTRHAPA